MHGNRREAARAKAASIKSPIQRRLRSNECAVLKVKATHPGFGKRKVAKASNIPLRTTEDILKRLKWLKYLESDGRVSWLGFEAVRGEEA